MFKTFLSFQKQMFPKRLKQNFQQEMPEKIRQSPKNMPVKGYVHKRQKFKRKKSKG